MRHWIARLTDPDRFRPNFLLTAAIGVTVVFFAIVTVNIWHAHRQMRETSRSLLALEQSVDDAIDLHARRVHALFESVSRNDRSTEEKYRQTIAALDCVLISFRNVPHSGLIAGNLSNCLHAHARLKTLETQALERMHAGDPDSVMTILFSLQRIQAEDDFHNGIHGADQTLTLQRDALANRFTNHLLVITVLTSGFILLLTGGWIIIIFLSRKFYRAHAQSQSALQESEIKYRRLIDALPYGVMIIQDMVIQFVNPALAAMIGCARPEDLVGVSLDSIVAEKDRDRVRRIAEARARNEPNVPDHYQATGLRTNHEEFPAEVYVRPIQYGGRFAVQTVVMDITERKRAEEALRESEERFRNLADMAPVLIWMAGVKRHTYYLNRTWLAYTGHGVGQEYGQGWQQGVHPEDLPRVMQTYDSAFASRSPFTIEYRLRNADGTYHWLLDTGVPRFTSEHQFTGFIGSCVDISARLDAEQALRDSEERFRTLYNKTPAMLHSIDKQGRIVSISDYWLEVMGYERNEVIGQHITDFLTPEYRRLATEKYIPEFMSKGTAKNLPHQFVTKSGHVLETILSAAAEYDPAGNFVRSLTVDIDITELRQVEAALRTQAKIIDEIHDGIITTDLNAIITSWNKGAERLYGYCTEETVGKHIRFLYPDPKALDSDVIAPLLRDGSHTADVLLKRKSGEVFDAQLYLSCSYDVNGKPQGMIGYSRDVTERKQAEAALHRLNRALKTISDCNQALIRAGDEQTLLQDICRVIVETGGYRFVWVGLPQDDEDKTVRCAAFAGYEDGYLKTVRISWADTPYGRGPTGTALRTGQMQVNRDARAAESYEPWREAALQRGYRSSIAVPLVSSGDLIGCLNIYAAEPDAFDTAETELLQELADDLAYGISVLRARGEHEKAMQALTESEEQFRTLFETMEQGVVYQDRHGRVIRANPTAERILGLSLDEMTGRTSSDPEWGAIREDGTPFPGEMHPSMVSLLTGLPVRNIVMGIMNRREDQIRWIEIDAVPQFRPDETEPYQVYTVFSNITERKQAEEALRQSEERFRTAFFTSPDAVNLNRMDDGIYVDINEGFTQTTGYSREDVIGKSSLDINIWVDHEDRRRLLTGLHEQGVVKNLEAKFRMKDGSVRNGLMSARLLRLNGVPHILSITRDIEDRLRAQEDLRQSEARFRELFDNMSSGGVIYEAVDDGRDFVLKDFNRSGQRIEKIPAEVVIGRRVTDVFPGVGEFGILDVFRRVWRTGLPEHFPIGFYKDERIAGWRDNYVYKLPTGELVAIYDDVTERKRFEEELERRATELQRSNAELERFAYVASHDLQEPLRMMASYAQLLERRYQGKLDTDADEFIGFITDGAERMRQLIRDLLTFSRVDTRAKPFHKVDCQAIFEKVLTDLRVAIEEAQATVIADPLPTVMADDTQLSQLLRNLIGNAIKFRTSAPPEIHIAVTDTDDHWQFSVRDNGIGIDPKYADQVFVIFKRLHGHGEYPGTGIGLAVCKKIVERHGGRIWMESAPGRGTTFFFTIPKQSPVEGRTSKDGR